VTAFVKGPRPTGSPIEPESSELVPGYRVIAHLNRGARLDVYDAWSVERDSRCVLKTLRPDRAAEKRAATALEREGRLLQRFTHPHLVRAYEVTRTTDGSRPVVVLETLGGETLSHLLHRLAKEGRHLDPVEVGVLGQQLASVLTYLHHHGWLHLDLKPTNIIVVGGSARLIDLSIARRPGRARRGLGTLDYLSPEQARGGRMTSAADVWGLGAVLYAALSGEPPYGYLGSSSDGSHSTTSARTSPTTDPAARADATWTATSDVGPEVETYPQTMSDPPPIGARCQAPVPLARLVDACLRRDPNARPTLPEVSEQLRDWLATPGLEATTP
jgi:eukaryotic-like serine/threonine-protein kinase